MRHRRYAVFIGRWQPFHNGHRAIIEQALAQGKSVAVGIRDTELSEANPYTIEQREEMFRRVYRELMREKRVITFVLPDLESINIGRSVGYDVNRIEVPETVAKISGTAVRAGSTNAVPDEIDSYLKRLHSTVWLTGLPCAGKTTLALGLQCELQAKNYRVIHLDGDVLRGGLNKDLGFSQADRHENLRRVAYTAKLLNRAGHLVVCSFIAPREEDRCLISGIIGDVSWVYVRCSKEECAHRDVKGMWAKARAGEIKGFTGYDAPYQPPEKPDATVDTENTSIPACVEHILCGLGFSEC